MPEPLLYYLAFNGGLRMVESRSGSTKTRGEFFAGRTLEDLTGCRRRPEIVFAAVAFDGGYRTEDGGRTWKKILEGDVRTITVDARDERVVYAGIGPIRLFRSEDCGDTWEPLDGLLQLPEQAKAKWAVPERLKGIEFPHVRYVFIHPDDADLLFVTLEHGGVVVSKDRGRTWEDISSGISYPDMHYLRNYPGSRERYYVSSARGFFRSDNAGRQWRRAETGMPWAYTDRHSYSHEWMFLPGNRMLLGGAKGSPGVWWDEHRAPEGVLLLSDDGGENWRTSIEGLPDEMPWVPWVLVPHPADRKTVFVGMGDGARGYGFDPKQRGKGAFYLTRDRGDSWESILPETPSILTAWVAAD
ncbi:MAG: WD40/YVTN/BNR-like repeat-containing protein [Candidatus Binatia bacterium]